MANDVGEAQPPLPDEVVGDDPIWDYTGQLMVYLKTSSRLYEESPNQAITLGKYKGRHVIGSKNEQGTIGGVYMCVDKGKPVGEAVVVEDDKYLQFAYDSFLTRITRKLQLEASGYSSFGEAVEETVLKYAYRFVMDWMPYSLTSFIARENEFRAKGQYQNVDGREWVEIPLSAYLGKNRGGVCRQQALFLAYLLEKAQKAETNLIPRDSKIRVFRNRDIKLGGHAWVSYTNPSGRESVLDTAMEYVGSPQEVLEAPWLYRQPQAA